MSLWLAQIFSQFGDRVVFVLFVAVLTANPNVKIGGFHVAAAELTSWLYVAFTIPGIVFSPIAGVYVDRWSNRAVMVVSNMVRALGVCLVATPYVKASPTAAFSLAFLISVGSQFFAPAESSAIPRVVRKENLYAANSLFFTTMMIALGFGFAIGEPIISRTGIGKAPFAVGAAFILAAVFVTQVTDNTPSKAKSEAWWEELRFGLAYIVNNPPVYKAILKITVLFSTVITLNIIAVALTQQVMNLEPVQFGYIVAAAGVGMGAGNFLVSHYFTEVQPTLLAYRGFILLGLFMSLLGSLGFLQDDLFPRIGMAGVAFHGPLIVVPLVIAVFIGISCSLVAVPTQSLLQAAVPPDLRGKVFGAQNTAMSAASTIPVVLTGVSADYLPGGVSTTLLILGLPTLIVGFINHNKTKRELSLLSAPVKQVSDNSSK
ncbi:MAG: MFS transporter [Cyanobacteria bacterium SZAS TMP-1]|nr:MFS transporter [Cyanobacteria bacterium SZAS TMP-1]